MIFPRVQDFSGREPLPHYRVDGRNTMRKGVPRKTISPRVHLCNNRRGQGKLCGLRMAGRKSRLSLPQAAFFI
jgi:hypothetical protein